MTDKKYSAIVFDLGQVLVPFDYQIFIDKINQHKSGLGNEFVKKYNDNYSIHKQFEKGKTGEAEFIDIMLRWLENKVTATQFCEYWSSIFSLNKELIALLPELKKKYRLYLLSNTNSIHKKFGYQHFEFLQLFDKLFLSHEVGYIKPEKEIYKAIESISGFPSKEHIFIDDILEYVESAKQLGWDGIQYFNYENLVQNFKERKIL